MYVSTVGNDIADVDADAKSDRPLGSHLAINDRNLLLHSERTPHGAVDTVEHHEKRVTTGVDNPTAMGSDRRVDDFAAQSAHPIKRSNVVQSDQAAVSDHVGMNHNNQLSPIRRLCG